MAACATCTPSAGPSWPRRSCSKATTPSLGANHDVLLAARVELHRSTGRPGDRLLLEEQDAVAAALDYADADELMRVVSTAARSIAWTSDEVWERVDSSLKGPRGWRMSRDRTLAPQVVLREGGVCITADGRPGHRPPAGAAGGGGRRRGRRPHRPVVARPAGRHCAPTCRLRGPTRPRQLFVRLLLAGRPAIDVIETLDQRGLFVRILPEWARGAVQAPTQRLPPLHRRPAPVRDGRQRLGAGRSGRATRPAGGGRAAARHRQGLPRRPHRGRHRGRARHGRAHGLPARRHRRAAGHGPPPPAAARRGHPPRPRPTRARSAGSPTGSASLATLRLLDALTEADSLATGPGGLELVEGRAAGRAGRRAPLTSWAAARPTRSPATGFPTPEQLAQHGRGPAHHRGPRRPAHGDLARPPRPVLPGRPLCSR